MTTAEQVEVTLEDLPTRNEGIRCQSPHIRTVRSSGSVTNSGPCSDLARWLWMCPKGALPICDARYAQALAHKFDNPDANHTGCDEFHPFEPL